MIQHIGFIMDGNRRWAKARGLEILYGDQSKEALKTALTYCLETGITHVSFYAFSLENIKRSSQETSFIFKATIDAIEEILPHFNQEKIRLRFVGKRELFPAHVLTAVEKIEAATASYNRLQVAILFCYGSQQEIVAASQKIAHKVLNGELAPEEITQEVFAEQLWTAPAPAPDIIIRTGGVKRLSNCMLYQAAYTELYFLDCLWPDLTKAEIEAVVTDFKKTPKNFGA
jgi:undecaprenyl diphosphate synthase